MPYHQLQEALKHNSPCQPIYTNGTLSLLRHRNEIPDCCFNEAQRRGDVQYIEVEAPMTRWAGGPAEVPRILPPHHFQEAIQSLHASRAQYRWPGPPSFPCLNNYPLHFSPKNDRCGAQSSCHHNRGCNDCNRTMRGMPSNHCAGGHGGNHCASRGSSGCTPGCNSGCNSRCNSGFNSGCNSGCNSGHPRCSNHHQMNEPKDFIRCQSLLPHHRDGLQDCSNKCQHSMPLAKDCGRYPQTLPLTNFIRGSLMAPLASNIYNNQAPIYMNRDNSPKFEFCVPIKDN